MAVLILVSFLLTLSLGFTLYCLMVIQPSLRLIKARMLQHNMGLKLVLKAVQEQENVLNKMLGALGELDKKSSFSSPAKEDIEQQYERAKRILKNGIIEEKDLLNSCDITLEEMELLSDLIKHPESAI